ncbi:hypothetical protein CDV31_016647 [Fusarium ambrosium]|uniref:Uncharacterized protein n=1 Tax=Fusarium ambrosium TaxID=131363 RepID=A0A428S4W2_9HYPO|nr:hypothetical protein CDV31_016647 [Fusarium ambrosium]
MSSTPASSHIPTFQNWTNTTFPSELQTTTDKSDSQGSRIENYIGACQAFMKSAEESGLRLNGITEPEEDGHQLKKVTGTWKGLQATPKGHGNWPQEFSKIIQKPDERRMLERESLPSIKDLLQPPQ